MFNNTNHHNTFISMYYDTDTISGYNTMFNDSNYHNTFISMLYDTDTIL